MATNFVIQTTDEQVMGQLDTPNSLGKSLTIHDHRLYGYLHNAARAEVLLFTEAPQETTPRYVVIRFGGLLAFHFSHDSDLCLLDEIEEASASSLFRENHSFFEERKSLEWPIAYSELDYVIAFCQRQNHKVYWINSHFGQCGWVIASGYVLEELPAPFGQM